MSMIQCIIVDTGAVTTAAETMLLYDLVWFRFIVHLGLTSVVGDAFVRPASEPTSVLGCHFV